MTTTSERVRRSAGVSTILERRTRSLADTDLHLREAGDDGAPGFTGHAAVFNSRTSIGNPLRWGWYEEIADGAFDKTLQEGDARFLVDHDSSLLVARVSAGDLRLSTDDVGLAVDADLDTEVSYVRDLRRNLEKRRITGMSFGFYVVRDRWETEEVELTDGTKAEVDVRYIEEVRLLEVSAVTFPAYEDTDAGLRSICSEVRAARLGENADEAHTDSPTERGGERPAPADTATQGEEDHAPADATRGLALQRQMHMDALAARYQLPTS